MSTPNSTTLSSAVGLNDTTVLLASISNVTAGNLLKIDSEFFRVLSVPSAATTPVPVLRGQEGTAQATHSATAQVLIGATPTNLTTGDWPTAPAGAAALVTAPSARTRRVKNYAAAGAISLPNPGEDMVAIIDGTGALAMTLANPSVLNDGDYLLIVANGKAAHTVTYSAGLGNGGASFDVGTFSASLQMAALLVAANGFWVSIGPSGATGIAGSPTWA